ncbi:MAG TPA: hypothetical protein VNG33_00390 [Polyangiaceae bacterium]|nr:hypothetical protein [Polyangiaceae bacterium]
MASKQPVGPVKRWREASPENSLDAELGDVFRALQHEQPLSARELAAVGRRLSQGRLGGAPRRRAFPQLMLAFAVLVGASGAAFAQWKRPGFWQLQALFASRVSASTHPTRAFGLGKSSAAPRSENSSPAPISEAPPVAGNATAATATAATATTAAARSTSGVKLVPTRPSALGRESELLQQALAKLRRAHDGPAALALLDQYQAEFPRGELAREASAARVDALLLSGRRSEALGLLSRLPLEGAGRASELRLLRAELYAERDCGRALADFNAVLATAGGAGLNERALYGRAACRLRLGDAAGGHADLEAYLQSYPAGRFADQVRSRLGPR